MRRSPGSAKMGLFECVKKRRILEAGRILAALAALSILLGASTKRANNGTRW